MTDSDPEPSRVQSLRTYGKRRQSPTLNPETYSVGPDEGSLENDTPGFPVVSASADEEASDSTNYHWKAMLTRIDAGKEDGKLLFPVSSSSGFTRALTPLTDEHRTPLLPDSVEETLPVILKSVPVPLSGPDQGSNILINASIDLPVAPPTHNDQPEPSDAEVGSGSRECREGKKKNNPRLTKQERLEMEKETARVKPDA
ncbi:uncharacterized protein EI90DRAFT_967361 [Cantharellus anzutake]|uniref:uncharacterized protein n=1 Tax=Cantharellus anzutake TaxID=1750568 RepID=UPI001907907D|nr:uncharacterized protein EI90DRAFT_967361 [Cantharellus anzutake]KAF8311526.1 hypothetical protein EI90DRAFT_967361 [Cantharellus anzutake]